MLKLVTLAAGLAGLLIAWWGMTTLASWPSSDCDYLYSTLRPACLGGDYAAMNLVTWVGVILAMASAIALAVFRKA